MPLPTVSPSRFWDRTGPCLGSCPYGGERTQFRLWLGITPCVSYRYVLLSHMPLCLHYTLPLHPTPTNAPTMPVPPPDCATPDTTTPYIGYRTVDQLPVLLIPNVLPGRDPPTLYPPGGKRRGTRRDVSVPLFSSQQLAWRFYYLFYYPAIFARPSCGGPVTGRTFYLFSTAGLEPPPPVRCPAAWAGISTRSGAQPEWRPVGRPDCPGTMPGFTRCLTSVQATLPCH